MNPKMTEKNTEAYTKYVSPTGELPTRELKFGAWYIRHKFLFQKIGLSMLIAWCVATVGFSLWYWGAYAIFGSAEDKKLLEQSRAQFENYEALQARYAARDITVAAPQVFRTTPGKYDFTAMVSNPNSNHVVFLAYHFAFAGGRTVTETTILLPGDRRPVAIFGHDAAQFPGQARLVIEEKRFRRVNPHAIADVEGFAAERLRFTVSNVSVSEDQVAFDVKNDSAYSYWQAVFYVQLLAGDTMTGLLYLPIDQFRAGETRSLGIRLFTESKGATNIRLSPVMNVFDPVLFMAPGA